MNSTRYLLTLGAVVALLSACGGDLFRDWKGSGFIGGLSSLSLVRIEFDGDSAREAQRFDMQRRIREVEQGPDGAVWLLEDGTRKGNSWLLKLTPQTAGQDSV